MSIENNPREKRPAWLDNANSRWLAIDSRERQIILASLLHEGIIDSLGKIIKFKYSNLDQMPEVCAKAIAEKLGISVP